MAEHENSSSDKKIKFRSISTTADPNYALNRIEDMYLPRPRSKSEHKFKAKEESDDDDSSPSLWEFLGTELKRSYALENDEEQYSARREKVYSFVKIPGEVESFMLYGFMQCADSFFFVYTFLPIRFVLATWAILSKPFQTCFGVNSSLNAAQICDLLKGCILVVCSFLISYVDTSIMYHLIKSQSVIKLYIFYNMLEVGDRLFSAFGQDVIDALYWTSTEPRDRKREHLGVIPHFLFAVIYVSLHAFLVLCQATTLNVAINASNKALLTIMISNNFVELKGSVFKKFDKNNLFQVACSDIRERFHFFILLLIVVIQTMKEYAWKEEILWVLLPDCLMVIGCEALVDWIKHAFITKFNELPTEVYRDYTLSLAYDMAQTRQKNAFSDHSDLVARRMGFIPLPLGVVMIRVFSMSFRINTLESFIIALVAYFTLHSLCVLNNLRILSKACDLIDRHQQVSINDVCLNEEMLRVGVKTLESIGEDDLLFRSQPNIQMEPGNEPAVPILETEGLQRAESEPSLLTAVNGNSLEM
ncbi:unnamed protein product [Nesidiocoris tenuis]|uniref:Uncharacterized protein n=1 Tax=Nesidiocoris tenuis TaxID=355587 RepID=A0A6H5H8Q8_9HEMI|nr:unnamed protein product [Nesidiocoris tenuis]